MRWLRSPEPRAAHGWAALFVLAATGCLYDVNDRCGPNQINDDGLCRCVQGTTISNNECVVPVAPPPPLSGGAGVACDPAANPCTDATFSRCQRAPNGEQYCTAAGCKVTTDCPAGYQCVANTEGSYCRRAYSGLGAACQLPADCAAYDANTCATPLKKCVVRDCPLGAAAPSAALPNVCAEGFTCFDASTLQAGLPNLCIENSVLQR